MCLSSSHGERGNVINKHIQMVRELNNVDKNEMILNDNANELLFAIFLLSYTKRILSINAMRCSIAIHNQKYCSHRFKSTDPQHFEIL